MPDLWRVDTTGILHVDLHPGQAEAWNSTARFVTVCAGTQGGKTSFGPLWLYREIQQRGPGDYLVAAPTFPLLNLKLLPEFKRFFEEKGRFGRYVGSPAKVFTFSKAGAMRTFGAAPDVPTHVFFGHAQDPDSLESATGKAAWLDEAGQRKFKHGSWQAILRRLSIHQGRVLTTTTPYAATGWFKKELHDRALAGDPDYAFVRFESRMNPAFPTAEWDRARVTLPSWKFDLFYRGLLTRPAGLIYDVFDHDTHAIAAHPIPPKWERAWGFDFGGVNLACVKLARDPATRRWVLYDAYHGGGRTAAQHAELLMRGDEYPRYCFGGAWSEDNWRAEFNAAGLHISRPPIKDVEVGIDRVYGVIKRDGLRVFDHLDRWIDEVQEYSRKLDDSGEPTEEIEDKSRYHLLDATRYIFAALEAPDLTLPPPEGWT